MSPGHEAYDAEAIVIAQAAFFWSSEERRDETTPFSPTLEPHAKDNERHPGAQAGNSSGGHQARPMTEGPGKHDHSQVGPSPSGFRGNE